jgi:hypothetical protein
MKIGSRDIKGQKPDYTNRKIPPTGGAAKRQDAAP